MNRRVFLMKRALSILLIPLFAGCGPAAPPPAAPPAIPEPEPARITVQHVLIAFRGAHKAPAEVTRSREEAAKFAREILDRVRQGEDIAVLARNHSTDSGPGRYTLVNFKELPQKGEIPRGQFIKPFVDVAFKLKVGEAGLVEYHEQNAPYGWHVIKRLE
jgi:hypothetical protein